MFGILKKKLSDFGDKLKQGMGKKALDEIKVPEKEKLGKQTKETPIKEIKEKKVIKEKAKKQTKEDKEKAVFEEIRREIAQEMPDAKEEDLIVEEKKVDKEIKVEEEKIQQKEKEIEKIQEEIEEENEDLVEEESEVEEVEERKEKTRDIEIKKADEDKRELKASVSKTGKLKGLFLGKVEIKESDVEELLWELELSLIESDVEQDAAHDLVQKIKGKLVGKKLSMKHFDEEIKQDIKEILTEMMSTDKKDILAEAKAKKPYKILILGPNGAGKTTSIAKLTHLFQKNKLSCVWAAADTFRSGAIDQLQVHADKLGVKVIKQQYGADPAAVAFDAVKSAEANGFNVVLIDSAGRQETNKNLMEELKKMERVIKPDLKIYVGEAYVGQGLLEQAKEFDEAIGIDGFILTKIDTDAKGGTSISLLYRLKKPILFVGTGQGYEDFEEFTPEFILNRII